MTKPELLIEVYTDPMCPWCWCGEARLEKTLASSDFAERIAPYMTPVVKLRPYILDPRLPATSFTPPRERYDAIETTEFKVGQPPTKREYYSKKFTNLDAFDSKISAAAKDVGLEGFQWLTDGRVGATWLAHRLLWKALQIDEQQQADAAAANGTSVHSPSLQERMASRLYRAFHAQSMDLSDIDVLAKLAAKGGTDKDSESAGIFETAEEARAWLKGDEGHDELLHQATLGEINGVQSVPYTIVQDGSDHSSEVLDHAGYMRMFEMQTALYK